jgi:hypothetical protein
MSQHFLLTAAARTVSLKQILRMEEEDAWTLFCSIRWPETEGAPVCPHCGCPTCWSCPQSNGAPRFESIKICGVAWPALRKAGRLEFFSH